MPTADEVMERLEQGNLRYVNGQLERPGDDGGRRTALTGGQEPFCCILGCSDSRVPPEILFDAGLGDLFVIRVAGNIYSDDVSGSIEYAVDHLHTPVVVVLGHQSCGAVTAALQGMKAEGDIQTLVNAIQPAVDATADETEDRLDKTIRLHAKMVAVQLMDDEPVLARAHREGRVRIVPAYYHLDSGKVEFLEPLPR